MGERAAESREFGESERTVFPACPEWGEQPQSPAASGTSLQGSAPLGVETHLQKAPASGLRKASEGAWGLLQPLHIPPSLRSAVPDLSGRLGDRSIQKRKENIYLQSRQKNQIRGAGGSSNANHRN